MFRFLDWLYECMGEEDIMKPQWSFVASLVLGLFFGFLATFLLVHTEYLRIDLGVRFGLLMTLIVTFVFSSVLIGREGALRPLFASTVGTALGFYLPLLLGWIPFTLGMGFFLVTLGVLVGLGILAYDSFVEKYKDCR